MSEIVTEVKKKEEQSLFQWLYPKGYSPYKLKWFDIAFALLLFAIALIGYIKTVTPTVCAGDSGELTTAVYNMGACHPPGYPLYSIVGKLFTFLPVGDIAYRMNLFSATCAAGAVLFLYLILVKLLGLNRKAEGLSLYVHIPAIAGAFLFAFSLSQWSQAVIGEVYALNVLLSSAVLYGMVIWYEEIIFFRKEQKLHFAQRATLLLAFLMGLSLTDHQLPIWYIVTWFFVLVFPALFILISEREKEFTEQAKARVIPIVGVVVLVVVAFVLFLKYAYEPALIFPKDLPYILTAIFIIPVSLTIYTIAVKLLKLQYNWVDEFLQLFMFGFWIFIFAMTMYLYMQIRAIAVAPLPEPKPFSWGDTVSLDILFNHMLRKQYGRGGGGSLSNLLGQLGAVFKFNVEQFNWVNIIFAAFGLFYIFVKEKIWAIFTVAANLAFWVALVLFINFELDPRTLSFQEVFFIQQFLLVAIYIAFGYQFVLDFTRDKLKLFKGMFQKGSEIKS